MILVVVLCVLLGVLSTSSQLCNSFTDCYSCTSHQSIPGQNCTYCEMPSAVGNYVCHDFTDITNPCSFYCPDDNSRNPSNCYVPPPNVYDPDLAMTLLYLSASSYSSTPGKCLTNLPSLNLQGWTLYKVFTSEYCDSGNSTCFGYSAYSVSQKAIVLGFRGTATISQILFEVIQTFIPISSWPAGGAVNAYFKDASDSLWPQIQDTMGELVQKFPTFRTIVTGHSLGGAIATLTASALVDSKILTTPPVLYTFGEPRVGNYEFAQIIDAQIPNAWRVVHYIDPFPHLPLCEYILVNGPIAVCNPCSNPNLFSYHHGTEVWYNISDYKFAPSDPHYVCLNGWPHNEALNCSTGLATYGQDCFKNIENCLAEHSYYFGVLVADCGNSDCTDAQACQ